MLVTLTLTLLALALALMLYTRRHGDESNVFAQEQKKSTAK